MTGGIVQRIEDAGWDKLTAATIPGPLLRFIVLIRVVGRREEFMEDADRSMSAQLAGPGMEEIVVVDFEIPTGEPDEDHPEGWEVNATVPVVIEFTPHETGAYTLTLSLRGRFALGARVSDRGRRRNRRRTVLIRDAARVRRSGLIAA